ncbi:MAG: efflux RND transporter periplasmic adaptor subunit [Bacillota bacterium]
MHNKLKWAGIGLIVVLLATFGLYQLISGVKTDIFQVKSGDLSTLQEEEGKVIPAKEFTISNSYGGEIIELAVKEGQLVQKGALLASLNTKELEFQLRQVQAQLKALKGEEGISHQDPLPSQLKGQQLMVEQAKQDLKLAEDDLSRAQKLYGDGAITPKELSLAENLVSSADLWLRQQEEALKLLQEARSPSSESRLLYGGREEALVAQGELLEYQIEKGKILAPISGVIANLTVKEGDLVSPGLPLMQLFEQDKFLIESYLSPASLFEITTGMEVKLTQNRKGEELIFSGLITEISPAAVERISPLGLLEEKIKVTILPKPSTAINLIPGTLLDVGFTISHKENVLFVPISALFPIEGGQALWLVEKGRARLKPVETGFQNNRYAVITAGLKDGDLVITDPQLENLKEGIRIK